MGQLRGKPGHLLSAGIRSRASSVPSSIANLSDSVKTFMLHGLQKLLRGEGAQPAHGRGAEQRKEIKMMGDILGK